MITYLKRLAIGTTLALLIAVSATSQVNASHSWGGYHWARTSNPFTLQLGDNLTGNWKPFLATTSSDWTRSTVLDTQIVAGSASPKTCKPASGRVEVCNSKYGRNGWLGIATIWIGSGGHITQGTVKVNDTYFQQAPYNTTAERNHVMCQEVGHTLGLGHQDESGAALGTCMDYSMDVDSQHPNAHDYEELELIYNHLDTINTFASSTSSSAPGRSDENGSLGTLVHRSENGRSEIYVRSDKNGQKVISFVNLATR
jgi:hypothetical protein